MKARALSWLAHLQRWLALKRCGGQVDYLTEGCAVALGLVPARRLDDGPVDPRKLRFIKCSQRRERCATCPRFKAYRESLTANEGGSRQLHVLVRPLERKPDVIDDHGKAAQVHHLDSKVVPAVSVLGIKRDHAKLDAVAPERAPGVQHPQHCAQQSNCQRCDLHPRLIHSEALPCANYRQRGHTRTGVFPWLVAIAFGLILGTAHHLDPAEDHSTEWSQSVELAQAEKAHAIATRRDRAARAICTESHGPNAAARWAADGALVCSTKQGRGVVTHAAVTASTAQVAP